MKSVLIFLLLSCNQAFSQSDHVFYNKIIEKQINSKVRLIADFNIPTGYKFNNSELGGISGVTYFDRDKLMGVSDDFGRLDSPRMYQFFFDIESPFKTIQIKDIIYIKNKNGERLPQRSILNYKNGFDAEGITSFSKDLFIISTETLFNSSYLNIFQTGLNTTSIEIPTKFLSSQERWITAKDPSITCITSYYILINFCHLKKQHQRWYQKVRSDRGIKHNKGFESLSLTPSKSHLFVANEAPLYQDDKSGIIRILQYNNIQSQYLPSREYAYRPDSIPRNGVTEVLALNHYQLLVLERAYHKNKLTIKIYKVGLESSKDISHLESLNTISSFPILKKELLIDLNDTIPYLSMDFPELDNFEAMTIGPETTDGNQTLILVSDNNFSKKQMTKFLVFELTKD